MIASRMEHHIVSGRIPENISVAIADRTVATVDSAIEERRSVDSIYNCATLAICRVGELS